MSRREGQLRSPESSRRTAFGAPVGQAARREKRNDGKNAPETRRLILFSFDLVAEERRDAERSIAAHAVARRSDRTRLHVGTSVELREQRADVGLEVFVGERGRVKLGEEALPELVVREDRGEDLRESPCRAARSERASGSSRRGGTDPESRRRNRSWRCARRRGCSARLTRTLIDPSCNSSMATWGRSTRSRGYRTRSPERRR